MQDSIEDYIKISKNIRKDATENIKISRELIATAQRKKECEDYAMKIVLFLLDGKLRPEIFLKCINYINQDYYQDVVDERAISKLCGYPICGKKIPDMPSQKYFISTKANKVYDISERKNYCSNFCYKASLHIKNQIDCSPLWLRNQKELKKYELLHPIVPGTPGEEINHGIIKASSDSMQFTSITHFAQISLKEAEDIEKTSGESSSSTANHTSIQKQHSLDVIVESDCEQYHKSEKDTDCDESNTSQKIFEYKKASQGSKESTNSQKTNRMSENEKLSYLISKLKINNEPKTKLINPPPIKSHAKNVCFYNEDQEDSSRIKKQSLKSQKGVGNNIKNDNSYMETMKDIKRCIVEWITLDTFIYIHGEGKIKQVLNENRMEEYFEKLQVVRLEMPQQLKYMDICKRLHMQELAEEKFDSALLGHSLRKPLPDFKKLKDDAQELDLKVKSFYKGEMYEQSNTNFPTKPIKENIKNDDEPIALPLVDSTAQNALRRKVFLTSINKVLKKLINQLKLEEDCQLSSVQELVKTFKLQAHNVAFKPSTWSIVALVLIKILSIKDEHIQHELQKPKSLEYIDLMLDKYAGSKQTIEEILQVLMNVDKFVESYITHNT